MLKINVMLLMSLLLLLLSATSCKKSNPELESVGNEVQFTSAIIGQLQGRMTGDAFEVEDAIGVTMIPAGQSFAQTTTANRRYVFGTSGIFSASEQEERIFYPGDGVVDFVAYYPYQDGATSTYNINVADQSDLGAIDLLRASLTGVDGTGISTVPRLPFRHELSKVVLNITGAGVALNGLTVRFNNINTRASFDLATALLSGNSTPANVSARVAANGASAEAILLPGEMGGQTITFTLGERSYTWTMPNGAIYAPATRYTYNITLLGDEEDLTEVELTDSSIADWTDVAGDSVTLNPNEPEPIEVLLYEETFGIAPTAATLIDRYIGYTAVGYINGTITYRNVGVDANVGDIRSTAQLASHLWLPANRHVTFQAAGINAVNARNLRLSIPNSSE